MFTVVGQPWDDLRQSVRAAKIGFVQEQRPVLQALGVQVLSFTKLDYVTKSRGGTGTDGISWKKLAPSTIKARNRRGKRNANRKTTKSGVARPTGGTVAIGIDTGLQLSSASPGFEMARGGNIFVVTERDATVGFGRSYSKHFDAERKLLPDSIPPGWQATLDAIVLRWALKILREKMGLF